MKRIQKETEIGVDKGVQLWGVDNNLQTKVQLQSMRGVYQRGGHVQSDL